MISLESAVKGSGTAVHISKNLRYYEQTESKSGTVIALFRVCRVGWIPNPPGNTVLPWLLEAPWLCCCVALLKERLCARPARDRALPKPAALQAAGAVHVRARNSFCHSFCHSSWGLSAVFPKVYYINNVLRFTQRRVDIIFRIKCLG